jgi:hypothetical protein
MAKQPAKRAVRGANIAWTKILEIITKDFSAVQAPEVAMDMRRRLTAIYPSLRKEAAALANLSKAQKPGTKKIVAAEPKAAPAPKKIPRGLRKKADRNAFKRKAFAEAKTEEASADYEATV